MVHRFRMNSPLVSPALSLLRIWVICCVRAGAWSQEAAELQCQPWIKQFQGSGGCKTASSFCFTCLLLTKGGRGEQSSFTLNLQVFQTPVFFKVTLLGYNARTTQLTDFKYKIQLGRDFVFVIIMFSFLLYFFVCFYPEKDMYQFASIISFT